MADHRPGGRLAPSSHPASDGQQPVSPPPQWVAETEELKTAFLASLSHEFRTPLNAILGYLDMLDEANGPEEARHIRALVRRHSGAMLAMLDNALYLAEFRLGRIFADPEVFALTPLVESIAREAEFLWGRPGVRLVLALDPAAGEVHTDKRAVRQIVRNLLTNAMCFTEEGQVILRTVALPDPEVVEIVVADTVSGISALHRAHLFEDYVAVQPEAFGPHQLGLGIGLAVAKQLGDLIAATLEVETGEAKSSVFRRNYPGRPLLSRESG